jgi:hypothetical protein
MCSKATLNTTVKQLKSIIDPQTAKGQSSNFANANFPVDQEGRTLHLGCKVGNVIHLGVQQRQHLLLSEEQTSSSSAAFVHAKDVGGSCMKSNHHSSCTAHTDQWYLLVYLLQQQCIEPSISKILV